MRQDLERRLRRLQALEDPLSYGVAFAVALLYFVARWKGGVIALYSWSIPFVAIAGVSKFWFAFAITRAERRLREFDELGPELPAARLLK